VDYKVTLVQMVLRTSDDVSQRYLKVLLDFAAKSVARFDMAYFFIASYSNRVQ
jgi:hypothetical protein